MKCIQRAASAGLFSVALLFCSTTALAEKVEFKVEGMVCTSCVQKVESVLLEQEGVKEATVNLETGQVTLDVEDPSMFSDERLAQIIEEAGYAIESLHGGQKGGQKGSDKAS